jgi:hypothetical protein
MVLAARPTLPEVPLADLSFISPTFSIGFSQATLTSTRCGQTSGSNHTPRRSASIARKSVATALTPSDSAENDDGGQPLGSSRSEPFCGRILNGPDHGSGARSHLCHSINRSKPGRLQNELLTLCDRFEAAERYGDGDLDTL